MHPKLAKSTNMTPKNLSQKISYCAVIKRRIVFEIGSETCSEKK